MDISVAILNPLYMLLNRRTLLTRKWKNVNPRRYYNYRNIHFAETCCCKERLSSFVTSQNGTKRNSFWWYRKRTKAFFLEAVEFLFVALINKSKIIAAMKQIHLPMERWVNDRKLKRIRECDCVVLCVCVCVFFFANRWTNGCLPFTAVHGVCQESICRL